MEHEHDSELNALILANRDEIGKLRSMTQELMAVVERERRLVKEMAPMLEGQRAHIEGQKENPEAAHAAPLPGLSA